MRRRPAPPFASAPALAPAPARGLSLVEIMVGLVLGLVLVAGLSQLVLGARQTSAAERHMAELQATGRIAIEVISREVRKAGYRQVRDQPVEEVFPATTAPFTAPAAVLVGSGTTALDLRLQGAGDGWTTDCLGNAVAAGHLLWQRLALVDGQIVCRTRNLNTGTDQSLALIPLVESINLSYGVDNDADGFADAYQTADAVGNWATVVSLNLQLRVVSSADGLADRPQPFIDFDGSAVTPADRRLRRSFSAVIALRNLLP